MALRFLFTSALKGTQRVEDPVGWDAISSQLNRSSRYGGIFPAFSQETLKWFDVGRRHLKENYVQDGIDMDVQVQVDEYDDQNEVWLTIFTGRINPRNYSDDGTYISTNIEAVDVVQKFLQREKVKVDLKDNTSLDGVALTGISPITLDLAARISGALYRLTGSSIPPGNLGTYGTDLTQYMAPGFQNPFNDHGITPGNVGDYVIDPVESNMPIRWTSTDTGEFEIRVTGDYEVITAGSGGSTDLKLSIPGKVGTTLVQTIMAGGTGTINYTNTFTISSGSPDTLLIYWVVQMASLSDNVELILTNFRLDIRKKVVENTASTAITWPLYEATALVLQRITSEADPLRSDYIGRKGAQPWEAMANGAAAFTGITSGRLLRQFPIAFYPFAINFLEIFDLIYKVWAGGLTWERFGTEWKFSVKQWDDLFPTNVILTLDNVDYTEELLDEDFVNRCEVGYAKFEDELEGTNSEVNGSQEYYVPVVNADNTLDLVSNVVAGDLTIEIQRNKPFGTENTQEVFDKDIIAICLDRSVDGSGVPSNLTAPETDDEQYNWRITPKRNLFRHKTTVLRSIYHNTDAVQFQDSKAEAIGNRDISDGYGTVDEDADWNPNRADRKNENVGYSMKAPIKLLDYVSIQDNPLGLVKFRKNADDTWKYGHILQSEFAYNTKLITLKLIKHVSI